MRRVWSKWRNREALLVRNVRGALQKSQRIGRNPKTGDEVPIAPRRVLVFRPSHVLKAVINEAMDARRLRQPAKTK
jgi:hypothetical protein